MRRIPELDALRGIAAIGIVAFHYGIGFEAASRFTRFGITSLELFFVLSGYLISSIILAHSGGRGFLRTFYVRRGLRIWPAYYLFILAVAAVVAVRPGMGDLRALPQYLTFTQNVQGYWFAESPALAFPANLTWSLAVEEQFYIVWPLLIGLVGVRRMAPLAAAFVVVAVGARSVGFPGNLLLARCDGFAIGGLLAVALSGRGDPAASRALAVRLAGVGLACAVFLAVVPVLRGEAPFSLSEAPEASPNLAAWAGLFASVIGLVVCHQGHPLLAPLRAAWLCDLGVISYGIYLYHMAAFVIGDGLVARLGWPVAVSRVAVSPALALGMAVASWRWFERPCLRLKDRFGYGRPRIATSIEPEAGPPGGPDPASRPRERESELATGATAPRDDIARAAP